jgi:hypothetical protein
MGFDCTDNGASGKMRENNTKRLSKKHIQQHEPGKRKHKG